MIQKRRKIGHRIIEQEWSQMKLSMAVAMSMIDQARQRMHMGETHLPHLDGRWNPISKRESSDLSVKSSTLATSWENVNLSTKTVQDPSRINIRPININRILDRPRHRLRLPAFETLLRNHRISMVSELVGHVPSEAERTLIGRRADDGRREVPYQSRRMPPPGSPSPPPPRPGAERSPVPRFMQEPPDFTPYSGHDGRSRYEPPPRRRSPYSARSRRESPRMVYYERSRSPGIYERTRKRQIRGDDVVRGRRDRSSSPATDGSPPDRSFVEHLRYAYDEVSLTWPEAVSVSTWPS